MHITFYKVLIHKNFILTTLILNDAKFKDNYNGMQLLI